MKLLCLSPFLLAAVSANQYEPEIRGLKGSGSKSKSKSKSKSGSKNVCSEDFSLEVGEVVSTHEETEEFIVLLEEDDEVEVLHYGPFTVVAECLESANDDDDAIGWTGRLRVKVNYPDHCDDDLIVFGDISSYFDDETTTAFRANSVPPGTEDEYLGGNYGENNDDDDRQGELWANFADDDAEVNGDNDIDAGALMASNGYYIGYSGDKLIGMTTGGGGTALFGEAFGATDTPSCIIAGKFNLMNFN